MTLRESAFVVFISSFIFNSLLHVICPYENVIEGALQSIALIFVNSEHIELLKPYKSV